MEMDSIPPPEEKMENVEEPEVEGLPTPTPRLMITKMVLENFKSYAGVKEIGPFHKCFSSVVGPNGSGKSNVIDAMLFVFGKRAKKLRLNKVSELIHNSDAFRGDKALTYARVSVHFHDIIDTGDGDEDYQVIGDSEIVVTRIAFRNNSSTYKLNGKNCAFRDVAHYLKSKGIDLDNNRFLILQGEVEMISMMPPKGKTESDEGLLEYLEDIIGSNQFLENTNDALLKVEQLNEQRQERLNRVKAVESEKDNLEGAKLEAEALLAKDREIRRKKNILYRKYVHDLSQTKTKMTEAKSKHLTELEEKKSSLDETQTKIREFEETIQDDIEEYDVLYDDLVVKKNNYTKHEKQQIQIHEDIKHITQHQKKLQTKMDTEKKKVEDARTKAQDAETNIPLLEEQIEEYKEVKQNEDAKLEAIYAEIKTKNDSLRPELEAKKKELAPIERERAVFQSSLDTALTEVKLLEDSTNRAKQQLKSYEKELESLDQNQKDTVTKKNESENELAESEQKIQDLKLEEKDLSQKENILSHKYSEIMAQAEEAKAAMSSSNSRSPTVRSILEAAKKGGELSNVGILGRLGDLATIHEKYDVAISTACGMLDYIVVETTLGAQKCLAYLRKKNLGRANFLPLEKMKKGVHNHAPETPESAPRLFDLISPLNHDILPALYLAVGNTLVAQDLETATRLAYEYNKRWRVVTIDGKLIETSGTMAGGGRGVRKGGMRLTSNNKKNKSSSAASTDGDNTNYELLEQQGSQALALLQQLRARKKTILQEIRMLEKSIKSLKLLLPKLTMEIEGFDTTREELTKRIPELRAQSQMSAEDTSKLRELNVNVQKCKSDMSACVSRAEKLEAQVAKIQKQMLDASGPQLKQQQKVCNKALKKLTQTTKDLNEARVTLESSESVIQKAERAQEMAHEEFTKSEEKREQVEKSLDVLKKTLTEVKDLYEAALQAESEKKAYVSQISEECEELKKSQSALKCAQVDLKAKIDHLEKALRDKEKSIDKWKLEIEKLNQAEEEDDEDDDFSDDDDEEKDETKETENETEDDESCMEEDDVEANEQQSNKNKETKNSSRLREFSPEALEQYDADEIEKTIRKLEEEKHDMAKNCNMAAIAEYRKKENDYLSRVNELDVITEQRNEARQNLEELRAKRLTMFMEGFNQITLKLKEMYQMITLGGDAELELVDSLDPFSEGIVFSVRPPKKSWKNIANLSGGEKTLSSLALVFALHHFKPTPLYVMDEIDAALDFKNVSIVANYIKDRTKNAQFIIISLRNNMFELADRLIGIYKTNNCTKSVTIDPRQFGGKGKQKQKEEEEETRTSSSKIAAVPKTPLCDRTNNKNAEEMTS